MNVSIPDVTATVSLEVHHEVEQFLFHEAALLDARRIGPWLELLAEDVHYYMPTRYTRARRESGHEFSTPDELAHFDDDKASLRQRVKRLQSGTAWSEEPASRTRHAISNVRVRPGDREDELHVDSYFVVYRSRLENDVDWFVGERQDVLRRTPQPPGFELARRTILMDQSLILASNLSIFY